ncbi:hypothetical protein HUO13_01870 [Saccharopolyspora erythraea]|uniref:hypothetical protein n=1 Tax=Saccharopolyspora erythraea TaxID=1836 RepID=UPI001BA472A5|nr:hypothetical protein [Saccharopolyspora erythraea]QUG99711.1 hypothetical protein HUO13_01870 [Saccharopolyspora erythraea]
MSPTGEASTEREPAPVPPELFCAAGWSPKQVLEHEEFLLQQHEAGALRLHDRGELGDAGPPLRRWRMSWSRNGATVHAVLATIDIPGHDDAAKVWFGAHCELGWGWDAPSPLIRPGLGQQVLVDPANALAATGSSLFSGDDALQQPLAVIRDRVTRMPVLFRHGRAADAHRARTFRGATLGAVGMVGLDDDAAGRLAAELPAERRIPERGARLVLPSWWEPHQPDICVSAGELDGDAAWRELADAALRAARWRPEGPMPVDDEWWRALFDGAWNDERVADPSGSGGARWYAGRDGGDKAQLRQRIQGVGDSVAELRSARTRRESDLAELESGIERHREELRALTRSRTTLARGVLRLRAEREAARAELDRTSLGAALRRTKAAQRLVRARSAELHRREETLADLRRPADAPAAALDDYAESPGHDIGDVVRGDLDEHTARPVSPARPASTVLLAHGVEDEIERLDDVRRRRCRRVLRLLGSAEGDVARHLRDAGVSPLLLGSTADPSAALTFRTADGDWRPFAHHVLLDHSGHHVLHYRVDGDVVHVGYVGPAL